jgi:hypothetical protein
MSFFNKVNLNFLFLYTLIAVMVSACGDRGEMDAREFFLADDVADSYLSFLNPQQSFSADVYQLIILPTSIISPQTLDAGYSLSIINSVTGLEKNHYDGQWDETSDLNWQSNRLNSHDLDLTSDQAIVIKAECSQACELFLLKSGYLYQQRISADSNDGFLVEYEIQSSLINSVNYAQQYYQAVDPNNERMTLDAWKSKNGFDQGYDVHVIFRDSKDLGYGRDMYARRNDDGSLAFYVNNFVVAVGKGNPENYGPLNLLAAVDQNFDYHLGSNAIEFSLEDQDIPDLGNPSAEKILKFFTFSAKDEQGIQQRITSADLDGRGIKHMPSICLACHGGTLMPLDADNNFDTLSLKSAKLNQLELDSFEFIATGLFSQTEQQAGIKQINQWVRDSYAEMATRDSAKKGYWDASFSQLIANDRYSGESFNASSYQENTVPSGWQQTNTRPEGVENLYLQVIEPHCISCHSVRGYQAGDDDLVETVTINGQEIKLGNAINFSSYEKFISYSELIIDYVYLRGVMPLSLRNAEKFWQAPYSAPALLASFLPSFDVLDEDGTIQPPGLPLARVEAQRLSTFPVTLNGGGSYFPQDYQWTIISGPSDHDASLNNSTGKISQLVGTVAGDYVIELEVRNSRGSSEAKILVSIDTSRQAALEINFVDDIKPILQNTIFNLRSCQSCHNPTTGIKGIPVHYHDGNERLYLDVRARVNLSAPMDSLLLQKPTLHQHGGGKRLDLETNLGLESYNTILQWIISGAPCGDDVSFCQ